MERAILVIDDDRMVTHALSNLLSREGYSATTSNDGYSAMEEVIRDANFDLIVCDLRMPGINGIETVRRIKEYLKSKNKPDVPVIFITGYADSDLHIKAKDLGKVILKPFENKDLIESIREYLEE
ncbi:MAG: response regulator [Candidatus Omnitrophica bacterium]|nr:response regulator [Candidatus Omnitrophota bacterium]